MHIVDANVLLYAVNRDTERHTVSLRWLDRALGGANSVGLTWIALRAFVRLATKPGLFPSPLSVGDAMAQVDDWLTAPAAHQLHPGEGHARILGELLAAVGTGGNLVNDAHLAALAIENRGTVVSFDNDFGRFPGVRREQPR